MILTHITKNFDRHPKNRDLSSNSNLEQGAKKFKEGSFNTSRASNIPEKVFTEILKSPVCVNILLNCIKTAEKQITQICENTKKIKKWQIKGER